MPQIENLHNTHEIINMWKEVDRSTLDGNLNTNVFVTGIDGRMALQRFPRENLDLMANLFWEYRDIGFIKSGGRFRRRSPQEQYTFGYQAARSGLKVLPPLSLVKDTVFFPYLNEAQPINQHFASRPHTAPDIVGTLFLDLASAHTQGFVYGDRWAGNMLIDPKFGLVHIDFDIEIFGRFAEELDVAQTAYHALWSCNSDSVSAPALIATHLSLFATSHDLQVVFKFMKGLAKFFHDTQVGGIDEEVDQCIALAQLGDSFI